MGPSDHKVPDGYERICCLKVRDKHDRVYCQEKLDGSCVAVAKVNGEIIPLGRAGWRADSSPYLQHRLFHAWVLKHWERFHDLLMEGERVVGEWLAQAHGTRYDLWHEPFVAFDLMAAETRLPVMELEARINGRFVTPFPLNTGSPIPVGDAIELAQSENHHGAIDQIEGVVYRVERHGKVDFLAKFVRPEKVDGIYLPEVSGGEPVWNWQPSPEC